MYTIEEIKQKVRKLCEFRGYNDDILCAESIAYGDNKSLKNFLLTEKMAIME